MVRGASAISVGGHCHSGAVAAREQPQDVREDAEGSAVETVCRGIPTDEHRPNQLEPAVVVGNLGIVPAVEASSSEPLMERASKSSSIHANYITSPHRS